MDSKLHKEIAVLSPAQRLIRYNQLAEDALQMAAHTYDQKLRYEFLAMAAQWRELADNTNKAIRLAEPPPGPLTKGGDRSRG